MRIRVYKTNKCIAVSEYVLNLSQEAKNWQKLNIVLRSRIRRSDV